jgi:hypothetical protein
MTAFITPEELKRYPLPVTDKQWEKIRYDQLDAVTAYATEHIEDYLDRHILAAEYTERIVGTGRYTLLLDQYPIISLTTVTANDMSETVETYSTTDFLIHSGAGIIEFVDKTRYAFYKSRVWVVKYRAGYSSVPGPIKHATALQAVSMLQPLFRGGVDFAEIDLISEINEQIVDMLERYKRKRIG